MQRRHLIICAGLIAFIAAAVWFGHLAWDRRVRTEIALAGVAKVPDLSRWPAELQQQITQESSAVATAARPAEPLGRLCGLYWANGYGAEAQLALTALRQLEPGKARWPYLQADLRWRAGDQAGAEAGLLATVERDPTYVPAWLRLGALRTTRGAADQARECYTRAAALAPGTLRSEYNLIYLEATQRGDRDKLLQRLAVLDRAHPGIKELHDLRAGLLATADPAAAARERRLASDCELALGTEDPWIDALTPLSFDSNHLMLRAVALRREARLSEAEQLLGRVVQLAAHEPPNPLGWDLLADLYQKTDRPAQARATLEQGVAQFPDEPQMPLLLTRLLSAQHQTDAAVATIRRAVARWPARSDLQAALGTALHDAGDFTAAIAALESALRLDPTLTETQHQLGLSLLEAGRRDDAHAAFEKALSMRPDYPETLFALAAMELEAGDFVAAEPRVSQVYALAPEEPHARHLMASWHLLKGMAAAKAGDLAEADRQYRAGLEVLPDFDLLLRESGLLAQRRGLWAEAVDALERYLRVKPADLQGHVSLGLVLREAGRPVDAATVLQRGLDAARQAGDQAMAEEFSRLLGH